MDPNLKGMLCSTESQEFSCLLKASQPPPPTHALDRKKKKKQKQKNKKTKKL